MWLNLGMGNRELSWESEVRYIYCPGIPGKHVLLPSEVGGATASITNQHRESVTPVESDQLTLILSDTVEMF